MFEIIQSILTRTVFGVDYYLMLLVCLFLISAYAFMRTAEKEYLPGMCFLLVVTPTCGEIFYHGAALISGRVCEIETPSDWYAAIMIILIVLYIFSIIGEFKVKH